MPNPGREKGAELGRAPPRGQAGRRRWPSRITGAFADLAKILVVFAIVVAGAAGLLYWRLSEGPISLGLLIGGPLAVWLLTLRDLDLFVPVFAAAFFFLSWFNGPIAAVIFDVVPAKISATVAGAYLLFIHLVGDTVAFPLVGALSDRFGLHRAVLVLPAVAVLGGLVILGATRTVGRDMARAAAVAGEIRKA